MSARRSELGETWIDSEELAYCTPSGSPSGSARRGRVRFPDGRLRIVRLGVPDTFFSIPAKPSRGRIGCVMVDRDINAADPDASAEFRFYPPGGGAA